MIQHVSRRDFVKAGVAAAGLAAAPPAPAVPRNSLPRWRGFNLTNLFQARVQKGPVEIAEDDFRMIADLGFDFVRVPMDYWFWVDGEWTKTGRMNAADVQKVKESGLALVDRIIELGRSHGIHVSLNFHRAPGYCVSNPDLEPFVLWRDRDAEDAFVFHWDLFTRRYRDIGPNELSFNLLNEPGTPVAQPGARPPELGAVLVKEALSSQPPANMTREDHRRVMTRAVQKIRETSPDRTIIIDGLSLGNEVVREMMPAGVAQSVHCYLPLEISHYRASWVDKANDFPEPKWPARRRDGVGEVSRVTLEALYEPWGWLVRQGVGVHAGEAGGFIRAPHSVFLRWTCDVLDILKMHSIGFALWNFRGAFGVLDSGRSDVAYEDWHGHKLDRDLLTLLQYH